MQRLCVVGVILCVLSLHSCTAAPHGQMAPTELQQRIAILEYFRTLEIGATVGDIEKALKPDKRLKARPPTQDDPVFRFSYKKGDFLIFFAADTEMSSLPDNWLAMDLDYSNFRYLGDYSAQTAEKLETIALHYGEGGD